jgi:hypothetical protein
MSNRGWSDAMADHTDMKTHQATYHSVINLLKYGAVTCFVIAMCIVVLISSGHK